MKIALSATALAKRAASFVALGLCAVTAQQAFAAPLIIDAFRVRGPSGANDEYIQIYNNSGVSHTVADSGAGTGYAVAASDGVARCVIPNGTVIPSRGHYLCTNSVAYSLSGYATGDATYTTDIPDNAGIAIFNTSVAANFTLANRMDAVGSTSEANTLYKEGTGYGALTPFSIDYSFVRDGCGKGGSITTLGVCPNGAPNVPIDTGNNATDFYFVDTNGTSAGAGQRLGAPGPQNLASPITGTAPSTTDPLDSCVTGLSSPPNFVRDFTSDPANNSTFGTVDLRRTFTNNTGAAITRLRFRIVDLSTFPAPSGFADLRPRTSTAVVVTVDRPPCGSGTSNVTVQGTTLEQPPSQPNGGGFYSTMSVGAVTLGTPLANGASIDVRFLLGIQQTGDFKIALVPETLPQATAAGTAFELSCDTEGCGPPTVSSIVRVNPSPTSAATVDYTVTFSAAVTGVDAADFALTTTGGITGASVTAVAGTGTTRTVTVNTGSGNGTIRLDVVDNDTIIDGATQPLGGTGAGNGNFTTGQVYTVAKTSPAVSSITRAGASPTNAASVQFNVTFSESVTGVDSADFVLTTTGVTGTSVTGVTGSGAAYVVTVNTGAGDGTIRLDVADNDTIVNGVATPLGGTGAGNGNFTTGEVYAIDRTPPSVTIGQAGGQTDPAAASPINFTVTFSEAVTGFTNGDLTIGGTAGATTALITGGPAVYNVAISGMTTNGTVTLGVAAGAAIDAAGNSSATASIVDNSVAYIGIVVLAPSIPVPALGAGLLALLALLMAGVARVGARRQTR